MKGRKKKGRHKKWLNVQRKTKYRIMRKTWWWKRKRWLTGNEKKKKENEKKIDNEILRWSEQGLNKGQKRKEVGKNE